MCGRFAFFSPREAIHGAFGVDFEPAVGARYNIAPGQNISVIRSDAAGEPIADTCRWGLVPSWAKDPAIGNRMINARAETIAEKPAYRQAFSRRRCVVLASGFYEWHTDESGKWPWFISCGDGDVFAMAGLWELWEKGPDESLRSCTIITRPANDFMGRLHHRMPVIMGGVQMHGWLQEGVAKDQLSEMLMGSQDIDLKAWRVSRKVNNPINDSAELIEEMAL